MKKGIIINVTEMSNASNIEKNFLTHRQANRPPGKCPTSFSVTKAMRLKSARKIWSTGENCFPKRNSPDLYPNF